MPIDRTIDFFKIPLDFRLKILYNDIKAVNGEVDPLDKEDRPKKLKIKIIIASATALIFVAAAVLTFFHLSKERANYRVFFSDVGQGDGAYLVAPNGDAVVFDCGLNSGGTDLVAQMKKNGVKRVEMIVISHAHDDHFGGVFELLDAFDVDSIVIPDYDIGGFVGQKLTTLAKEHDVEIVRAQRGDHFATAGCRLDVLSPQGATECDGSNNDSLVVMLDVLGTRLLFTGDAEAQIEEELVSLYGSSLAADVLKVAHHGSMTSTTEDFLSAVSPKVAVISAGESNPYGLPSRGTLTRLENVGAHVCRTDIDGTICITVTDDGNFSVSAKK